MSHATGLSLWAVKQRSHMGLPNARILSRITHTRFKHTMCHTLLKDSVTEGFGDGVRLLFFVAFIRGVASLIALSHLVTELY